MNHLFIYGSPGVGKLTVAEEFSKATSYKLLNDHVIQDPLNLLFERGSEPLFRLRHDFFVRIVEEFLKQGKDIVSTFCYGHPKNEEFIRDLMAKVEEYDGNLYFTRLVCNLEEQCKRIRGASRKGTMKLRTMEQLAADSKTLNFTSIPFVESLKIDNTKKSPGEVVEIIRRHYRI